MPEKDTQESKGYIDGMTSATEPLSEADSQKLDSMLDDILGDLETLTPKVDLTKEETESETE